MVGRLCLGFGIGERVPSLLAALWWRPVQPAAFAWCLFKAVERLPSLGKRSSGRSYRGMPDSQLPLHTSPFCTSVQGQQRRSDAAAQNPGLPSPSASPAFPAGFVNQVAPLYLSEMAPYNYRGGLNVCFQASMPQARES